MSEETPVPETLQTIAEKIDALGKSIDARFAQVDARFAQVDARFDQVDVRFAQIDVRFDELKAQLRTEIEVVDGRVKLVYDVLIAQRADNQANAAAHQEFARRLDDHDVRLIAIERRPSSSG